MRRWWPLGIPEKKWRARRVRLNLTRCHPCFVSRAKRIWRACYRISVHASPSLFDAHCTYLYPCAQALGFVDSGATFSMLTVDEAARIGIDWCTGRHQMIVVGDGSYIPTFIHDLPVQIGGMQI